MTEQELLQSRVGDKVRNRLPGSPVGVIVAFDMRSNKVKVLWPGSSFPVWDFADQLVVHERSNPMSQKLGKLTGDLRSLPYRDLIKFAEVLKKELSNHAADVPGTADAILAAADEISPPKPGDRGDDL